MQLTQKKRSNHAAMRVRILEAIEELQTATCDEIEVYLSIAHQTASARICELRKGGKIIDTGKRRFTRLGSPASVYKVNEEIREWNKNHKNESAEDPKRILTRVIKRKRLRAQRPSLSAKWAGRD